MTGWIKLYRSILDHWVFQDADYFRAWCTIILRVNHEPKKVLIRGEVIECGRGQSVLSLQSWVKEFGVDKWSIQKVRTFFKLLENDGMITTEGMAKTTRLTVCNYEDYQNEQHSNNKQPTRSQHAANTHLTTTKETKNDNNDKKIEARAKEFYQSIAEYKDKYTKDTLRDFYDYWTEPNKSKTKMRFELQNTWDLNLRLQRWARKDGTFTSNGTPKKEHEPGANIPRLDKYANKI